MQIIKERGISFKSSGNIYGVPKSSRPQAHLIKTVITSGEVYTKVRSLLRKENILYLHQIQNKDGLLMTWMDFTKKYKQSNSSKIPKWFKILESTIIMNEHRNINVIQCETMELHKIDNQISDDLFTSKFLMLYYHNRGMYGLLVKAGTEDAKKTATFVIHKIEANFGIVVDGTLSSTKTKAKANAIKAVIEDKRIDFSINKVAGKKTLSLLKFMTTTRAKSKKVANSTFPIVTNKVSTQEGLSVIEAARQNVLVTFPLKNISEKLPLAASGSFFSPLAGSFSPVKVLSKRHTWVNSNIVSTTSKSPKIFNNKLVNKMVFPALTTSTTSTTSVSQMATKTKNSKKQQQIVTTAMVTLNPLVVSDEILGKISIAAASPLPNMNGNSNDSTPNMEQDQPLAVLPNVVISSRSSPAMEAKQSIISDNLKDWANQMKMESSTSSPVSGVVDNGA
ncbi:hypothetical protein G9A89_006401 [Geosiphon pyriformis]|nr:hypothetical protein G9A89_006401 [Geosiphon pyriformis]